MCKKVWIAALAVVIGLVAVSPMLRSYLRVWRNDTTTWLKKQETLEHKIKRLRSDLTQLANDDKRHFDLVARQIVEAKEIEKDVATQKVALAKEKTRLQAMRAALKGTAEDVQTVSYSGESFPRATFTRELETDFDAYQAAVNALASRENELANLKATLAANRQKVSELKRRRTEMAQAIDQLERDLAQQRLAESRNCRSIKEADYSRMDQDIKEARRELEVRKTSTELEGQGTQGTVRAAEAAQAEKAKRQRDMDAALGTPSGPTVSTDNTQR
jgi:DNA repair exonuclease SbcCD ATPase subunit